MKFKISYFLISISMLSIINCGSYNKKLLKENSKLVTNMYLLLIKESDKFLSQPKQENYIEELNHYIVNCKDYDFNDGREPTVILNPGIVDKEYAKSINIVLKRGKGISGDRIEFISFISAKYFNNKWNFQLKKGHGFSFSYINSQYVQSANEELAKESIRNLMLMGYFKKDLIYDDSLFNSSWYTLN